MSTSESPASAPLPAEALPAGFRLWRFVIVRRLGSGPLGAVYLADEPAADRQVAVRVLTPEFLAVPQFEPYFRSIAARFAGLELTGLCRLYMVGKSSDLLYMVMGHLPGGTLRQRLQGGPLPLASAVAILNEVAPALAQLHSRRILHLNIKPSNILFDAQGRAVLSEVGMAPMLYAAAQTFADRARLGVPLYASPEQLAGKKMAVQSDVYSLGAVLFEMVTGQPPFTAADPQALFQRQFTQPVPQAEALNPALPREIGEAIARALAFPQDDRFGSIAELMAALPGGVLPAPPAVEVRPPAPPKPEIPIRVEAPAPPARPWTSEPPIEAGARFGRFLVGEHLASTGLGHVYRAKETAVGREVALKVPSPEINAVPGFAPYIKKVFERFAALAHSNLVPLYHLGESGGRLHYAVGYLPGGTVKDRLQSGPLEARLAVAIVETVAPALAYLHRQGITHLRLKPSNILFDAHGKAHLSEVGLAPALYAAAQTFADEARLGVPLYASPEALAGKKTDARSDLYSLGAVLFEMVAGRPPFQADSVRDLFRLQVSQPVPLAHKINPEVPKEISAAIAKALSYSRAQRFATVGEFVDALAGRASVALPPAVAAATAVAAPPSSALRPARVAAIPVPRRPALPVGAFMAGGLGVAALALAGITVLLFRSLAGGFEVTPSPSQTPTLPAVAAVNSPTAAITPAAAISPTPVIVEAIGATRVNAPDAPTGTATPVPVLTATLLPSPTSTLSPTARSTLPVCGPGAAEPCVTATGTGGVTPPLPTPTASPRPSSGEALAAAQAIVDVVNFQRNQNGLFPLANNSQIANIALARSQDMAARGYFSHTDPATGEQPFASLLADAGFLGPTGENLFRSSVQLNIVPSVAIEFWMNSPTHRANILDEKWTQTGAGLAFNGSEWIVTLLFAGLP